MEYSRGYNHPTFPEYRRYNANMRTFIRVLLDILTLRMVTHAPACGTRDPECHISRIPIP